MESICIRGREYKVDKLLNDTGVFKDDRVKYKLTGKRGAVYYTLRNVPNPKLMFIVPEKFTTSTMDGVWLTDADGVLEVLR